MTIKTLDEIDTQDILAEALKDVYAALAQFELTSDVDIDLAECVYLIITKRFAAAFGAGIQIGRNAETIDDVSVTSIPNDPQEES